MKTGGGSPFILCVSLFLCALNLSAKPLPLESLSQRALVGRQYAFSCTNPFQSVINMILKSNLSDQFWM